MPAFDSTAAACEACAFWTLIPSKDHGQCRRHPPHVGHNKWPETSPRAWCGEFEPRAHPAPSA
jgi:hypothetical protein